MSTQFIRVKDMLTYHKTFVFFITNVQSLNPSPPPSFFSPNLHAQTTHTASSFLLLSNALLKMRSKFQRDGEHSSYIHRLKILIAPPPPPPPPPPLK